MTANIAWPSTARQRREPLEIGSSGQACLRNHRRDLALSQNA